MPWAATYCHSGPSSLNVQLRHVVPPSVVMPNPLPTVPYQTVRLSWNAMLFTNPHERPFSVWGMCLHASAFGAHTKMPSPYVPTHVAWFGAISTARTWTPQPVVSGRAAGRVRTGGRPVRWGAGVTLPQAVSAES